MTRPMRSWAAEALRRQRAWLSARISRLRSRMPATAVGKTVLAAVAVAALSAGTIPAAMAALHGPAGTQLSAASAVRPQLTTSTPAPFRAVVQHPYRAACPQPVRPGQAACLALVRTGMTARKGLFAAPATAQAALSGYGYGPSDLQSAYNLPSATAGGGATVAVVDAYDDPTAEQDLGVYRAEFGLPACTTANGCFEKVNQEGVNLATDPSAAPPESPPSDDWTGEESLDLDMVSAICPNCNIILVEADNDGSIDNLGQAEDTAVALGATFISNSWGAAEASDETSDDQYFNHPGVVITASAGDSGWSVNYPSASPYVTAVGGTELAPDSSTARGWAETAWGNGTEGAKGDGTGSGCSSVEPQPSFQQGISQLTAVCQNRATADVSADADLATGVAVYDTSNGNGGWNEYGGTSVASPIIAATYALAGEPAAGTYPNTYPYLDTHQSADLNNITSGSNGDCGNILCNAGPGWNGPTGLGTPNGVGAFTGAPQGQISGQVTDASTGKPIVGATVTAQPSGFTARTDSSGTYDLTLAAGTYTLTAAGFGYAGATQSGVQVTANQTISENFTLTAQPGGTLSGTVTDGSGQGWPLHAEITIPGDPSSPFWTSPYTGKYSITLPQGSYALQVSTDYPGYQDKTVQVTVGASTTDNITLDADLASCTAPGYGPDGLTQGFAGWTGGTAQQGWSVTSPGGAGWRFDNPGNQAPPPSGSINPVPGTNDREFVTFDPDHFAIADASYYSPRALHTTLTSPPVSLAGQQSPQVSFDSAYYPGPDPDTAQVQLSLDGGRSWATIWHQDASNALGPTTIAIPQAAGKTGVQARWVFDGQGDGYWAVGSVLIGTGTCVAQPGGLVAGTVTDKSTGDPIGAQITDAATPPPYPWPEGIAGVTDDPAVPGGFYWLFTPAGSQQLTVTQSGYTSATATVSVQSGTITRHDVALTPAAGS
jgi:hypothetical protein